MTFSVNRQKLRDTDLWLSVLLSLFAGVLYFSNELIIPVTALLLLACAALIGWKAFRKQLRFTWPQPIVFCWLAGYLVRVVWLAVGPGPQHGAKWMDSCLPFILFPLLFQYLPISERVRKNVLTFFVHFTALFCLLTLLSVLYHCGKESINLVYWLRHPKNYYSAAYAWTNADHPSFLCVIYLLALPVALYLKNKYRSIPTAEIVFLGVMELAVILLTGTRVGLIIYPLLLLLMLLYTIPSCRRKILVGVSALVLLGGGTTTLFLTNSSLFRRFGDPLREQLWQTSLASIKKKPLLGVGTGGMKEVITSPALAKELGYNSPLLFSHPHNQYLGEVMHFGFIGASLLFATLGYLLVRAVRRKKFLLQSLLLILFVFMFTEMPFDITRSICWFLFFSSLFNAGAAKPPLNSKFKVESTPKSRSAFLVS
jgi:O-antigen ligase